MSALPNGPEERSSYVIEWVRSTGLITGLRVGKILDRLEHGTDEDLVNAIYAVLNSREFSAEKLDALKNFLVEQLFVEEELPTPVPIQPIIGVVPKEILQNFFSGWPDGCRFRQFYDSYTSEDPYSSSRLFGHTNIGNYARTNLEIPGQFRGRFLVTSWWLLAPRVEALEDFLAKAYFSLAVSARIETKLNGLALLAGRQPLLVPIHERANIDVRVESGPIPPLTVPIYLYLEGWWREVY